MKNTFYRLQQLSQMSFKGVVELVLHIEQYYIIQYPQQGLFSFDSTIYQVKDDKKNYAIPYQILNKRGENVSENTQRLIVEPRFDDEKAISSTGLAKFSDEHLEMDDWFSFRLELEGYPQLESDNIFLQIDFRFNQSRLNQPQSTGQFKQTVIFRLNDLQNGIFNHAIANFQPPYRSQLLFTLFGFISSFKFAKYEVTSKQVDKYQKKRSKISTIKQLLQEAKGEFPDKIIENIFYGNYIKKLRICQYLIEQRLNYLRKQSRTWEIKISPSFLKQRNYKEITQKEFKQFLDKYLPSNITIDEILIQINAIREENFEFVQKTIEEWRTSCFNRQKMEKEHLVFNKEKYGEVVFRSILKGQEDIVKKGATSSKQNKKIARSMRDKNIIVNTYPIEDIKFQREKQSQQLVFYEVAFPFVDKVQQQVELKITPQEQKIQIEGSQLQYSEKHMLVVLCHGYQGSYYDMQLIKRWIQNGLPDAYYLISRSNEDNTDGDIEKMGKNLADQVEKYIVNYMEQYQQENVIINFVGHSMGGIIARAALPYLFEKYKKQFGFFCSLSSPHLGYLNGVSGLIKVGLWAIKKFKKIDSLAQLSMQEHEDPRKTFLYSLSKVGHLRYFRRIILLSSYEDSYVSWHSARISPHLSSNSSSKVQTQMCDNMMSNNIYGASVHRLDINFNVKTNTLDSFIGRTAHINLIIRENMFKTITLTIPQLFNLNEYGREGLFL